MHTNENIYDTFIPRWFGRLGNNIQQISNGIYFCERQGSHFTSPDHPMIDAIDLHFGDNEYKIPETSHNWFYFFNGPDADFTVNVNDLNYKRKKICERYILPKLKIDHTKLEDALPENHLVVHLRSGDIFTHWPGRHPQNPLGYFLTLFNLFEFNVSVISEDNRHPFLEVFNRLKINIEVLPIQDAYTKLLRASNIATSGIGSFPLSAALCSKNIKKFYCTDLIFEESLNPTMLKDHLEVFMMPLGDKYIKIGEWKYSPETFEKLYNYSEYTSFRRL
jgi:hypothetical protein